MAADRSNLLVRYADQGEPRGADAVLAAARQMSLSAESSPECGDPDRNGRRRRILIAAAAVVLLLMLGGALVSRESAHNDLAPGASTTGTVSSPPSTPTPEQTAEGLRRRQELADRGWESLGGYLIPVPGDAVPRFSYKRTVGGDGYDAAGRHRTDVYDQPDGVVIGYWYDGLGVVSKAVADAPGFDAGPLYRANGLCEPTDQPCVRDMNRRVAGPMWTWTGTGPAPDEGAQHPTENQSR